LQSQNGVTLASCISLIRDVPDFPRPGIVFKDITPLLSSGPHFTRVVDDMASLLAREGVDSYALVCPEARGFIFGSALAYRLGVGFVPVRKPSKLPYRTHRVEYALEYGTDSVEMHVDAIAAGQEVVLIDDVLATGGTTAACAELVESAGARVRACVYLMELGFLRGREKLARFPVHALIQTPG
jgi:adenine phosphoribosyltransferase